MSPHRLASCDAGIELAVWESGPSSAPTVLLVHGYPDTHQVWDAITTQLAERFHVVAYDVRGAGASSAADSTRGYALERLAEDLAHVARAFGQGRPVHVVGHDWGSIQSWEALADPRYQGTFASFTSISGPCLDHVAHWVRATTARTLPAVLRQGVASWYIGAFHTPGIARVLPRLLARRGAELGLFEDTPGASLVDDSVRGISLYRANIRQRMLAPRERHVRVPVQQIVLREDRFVTPALADTAAPWVAQLYRRELSGGHWALRSAPSQFTHAIAALIDFVESKQPEPPAWTRLRVDATSPSQVGVAQELDVGPGAFNSQVPPARKFRSNVKQVPLEWLPGDRQTTHTFDVLSLLLPIGEGWFAAVFREALPYLDDPAVLAAARGFMEQETQHGRAHVAVLGHLASHGLDTSAYLAKVAWLFRQFGSKPFGWPIPRSWAKAWLVQRVGAIAAVEQLTTTLGDWVLTHDAVDRAGADPEMMDLLRWHGAEEVEHRAIAFEVHQALGGTHAGRVFWMSIVAPLLVGFWVHGVDTLMTESCRVTGQGLAQGTFASFTHAGQVGTLPTAGHLLRGIARFCRPSHHPRNEGNEAAACAYLQRSSGVGAN